MAQVKKTISVYFFLASAPPAFAIPRSFFIRFFFSFLDFIPPALGSFRPA